MLYCQQQTGFADENKRGDRGGKAAVPAKGKKISV